METEPTSTPPPSSSLSQKRTNTVWHIVRWIISGCLLVLFLISAILQSNDDADNAWVWMIYYTLNSLVALLYILSSVQCGSSGNYCCFRQHPSAYVRYFLAGCGLVMVFGSVLLIVFGVRLATTASSADAGADADSLNDKQETSMEVAGAALGVVSCLYHGMAAYFCCRAEP